MNIKRLKQAKEILPEVQKHKDFIRTINDLQRDFQRIHELISEGKLGKSCDNCRHDIENDCCDKRRFDIVDYILYLVSASDEIKKRVDEIINNANEEESEKCVYLKDKECAFEEYKPPICTVTFCNQKGDYFGLESDMSKKAIKIIESSYYRLSNIVDQCLSQHKNEDEVK